MLSREAAKFSYEKSLFVRIQEKDPKNIHLLSIQYRMHPSISVFPSREFYNSDLKDGPGMSQLRAKPWHQSTVLGSYRFFDVAGRETRVKGTSLVNNDEIKVAIQLYERLTHDFGEIKFQGMIGIVTPYRQQLSALKNAFAQRYGQAILAAVEFNTVDAFQGREREIIMFSCVRAAEEGGIGFLSDIRRMNVGLTRAKSSLFVLGNSQFLVRNHMWRRLIEDAQQRNMFSHNSLALLQRPVRVRDGMTLPTPAPLPPLLQQQVDDHWDPMDIDDEPPADKNIQAPQAAFSSSNTDKGSLHTGALPMDNGPLAPGEGHRPPRNQGGRDNREKKNFNRADIKCHSCGETGHKKVDCFRSKGWKKDPVRGADAPKTPTVPVKRPHSPDEPSDVKRLHTGQPENDGDASLNRTNMV